MHAIALGQSDAQVSAGDRRKLRVCIFRPEQPPNSFEQSTFGNEEGLAEHLSLSGHDVTLVDMIQEPVSTGPVAQDRDALAIRLVRLPFEAFHRSPHMERSYAAYRWLKDNRFDVVQFPDWMGCGYYSMLAKHQGLAFHDTSLTVALVGPWAWARRNSPFIPSHLNDLIADFLERKTIEFADALVSPDQDRLDWMLSAGWKLPDCCLISGSVEPPRSACEAPYPADNLYLDALASRLPIDTRAPERCEGERSHPLVSVCLVHFNRPQMLRMALRSLKEQFYPNFEVVLVDDGSTSNEAINLLAELEQEFSEQGWQLVRQKNRYLGAARNTAAHYARGEYLLFMDDDNYAKRHELTTLVEVAQRTGADIVSCAMDTFHDADMSEPPQTSSGCYLYFGQAPELGLFDNFYGDANSLVRKQTFMEIGGFSEDRGTTWEDFEFHIKAGLSGARIETIPEPLYWYRVSPDSMFRTTSRLASYMRALRPYLPSIPKELVDVLVLAQGYFYRNEKLATEVSEGEQLLTTLKSRLASTWADETTDAQIHDGVLSPESSQDGRELYSHLIQLHWSSISWKMLGPLRTAFRAWRKLPPEVMLRSGDADLSKVLSELQNSIWWNLTGPLRALGQVIRGLRTFAALGK